MSQPGFINDVLAAYPVTRTSVTPTTENLFRCDTDSHLVDVTEYASRLMKLNFLMKRSRPDLSLAVSYLATRMNFSDHHDDGKLTRVYQYLQGSKNLGIVLRPRGSTRRYASYSVHCDYKSHTAILICIGTTSGPVFSKSAKQKLMTDSSTFSELVALHDGVHPIQSTRNFMQELSYHEEPAVVHQDNMSIMFLAKSRHIPVRYYYISDCIERGEIVLEHCASQDMRADYLSKPQGGKQFRSMGNAFECICAVDLYYPI